MEDTARLAQIEMCINNENAFENLLKELLQVINHILDNPHDCNNRKLKSDVLRPLLKYDDFCAYLKYIGFELQTDEYVFPQEQTLSKLKAAQAAIEKKIIYCYGPDQCPYPQTVIRPRKKICQLQPANILTTNNKFFHIIQNLFNNVLKYEDEKLLEFARSHIPLTQLQMRALERMREYQKKIKTGAVADKDMTFEMALLAELVSWFKHKFFTWMDKPPCTSCGGATRFVGKCTRVVEEERCLVEEFRCTVCPQGTASFPRHNSLRTLLRTRRGRCGEYANCFALLCRSLGYDTRYVDDTTDHVWCEVFDYDSSSWVHVDPSEARLNTPLMYSHGWNKRLSYVIAVSRDDLQDVTWRYTTQHREVLSRRTLCPEWQLVEVMVQLRAHRQAQLSAPRRRYLAERALRELVQLQVERKPEDDECQGRLSGSLAWRQERGEAGASAGGHVFQFDKPGVYVIRYYPKSDEYRVSLDGQETQTLAPWTAGVFRCEKIFRKVETDWKQVYLTREEGEDSGSISWKVSSVGKQLMVKTLDVRAISTVFESGQVDWTYTFDDQEPMAVKLDTPVQYSGSFTSAVITARLSGGAGREAWQHAQLFRQPLDNEMSAFEVQALVVQNDNIDLD